MSGASREKDESGVAGEGCVLRRGRRMSGASRKNVSYRIVVASRAAAVHFPVHALRLALIFAGRTRALTP